jgi:hypothetical protein
VNSARDDILAAPENRPHFIARDLRALLETQPQQGREETWFTSGNAAVTVRDSRLVIAEHDGVDELDIVRAACCAVWSHVDAGGEFDSSTIPNFVTL